MSSYGLFDSNFDKPVRKWKKPEPAQEAPESPRGAAYMYGDFVGGCGDETPRKRWQKPKPVEAATPTTPRESHHEEWLSSPSSSARNRPAPIKIEGMSSSIKNNPFFKNFGGI